MFDALTTPALLRSSEEKDVDRFGPLHEVQAVELSGVHHRADLVRQFIDVGLDLAAVDVGFPAPPRCGP